MVERSKLISSLENANSRHQTLYTYMFRAGLAHGPYPIIDIGGDKNRMNKMTPYRGELVG